MLQANSVEELPGREGSQVTNLLAKHSRLVDWPRPDGLFIILNTIDLP